MQEQLLHIEPQKQTENNSNSDLICELYGLGAGKKYEIIYADPPWLYKCGKNHLAKKSMINGKVDIHYDAMPIEEIKNIDINRISADNSLLFLWVTSPFLKIGIDLLYEWGFEYSTVGFVWYKEKTNPGSYTLSECELCLIGKKGKIPKPRGSRKERQFISEMRTEHSTKPTEVRERIERMFPQQNKIELFARTKTKGWDVWGNQAPKSV